MALPRRQYVTTGESLTAEPAIGPELATRNIVPGLVGAVIGMASGLVGAILFEDPLRNRVDRLRKWRRRRRGKRDVTQRADGPATYEDTFSFGPLKTSTLIVDGNGETSYHPRNIQVQVSGQPVKFPEELQRIRSEIQSREEKNRKAGLQYLWNGLNFAVQSFSITRTGLTEESEVSIGLQPSDYYTFLAAKEALDKFIPKYGKTVRQKFLEPFYWNRPVPFLSSSFGVNVSLVTADNQLVVCRRSEVVGSRPLEFTVSANEGLSRGIDDRGGAYPPDLYECGYRALKEELGVEKWDLEKLEILAFSIDLQLHQWGCLSWARLSELTFAELHERYNRATKDKFENIQLDSVSFTPKAVARYILDPSRRMNWYGGAPASFYLTLVLEYGRQTVERAIRDVVHEWDKRSRRTR